MRKANRKLESERNRAAKFKRRTKSDAKQVKNEEKITNECESAEKEEKGAW